MASEGEKKGEQGHGGYLVNDVKGRGHLPTHRDGKPDHHLMGAAWAALHGGYRGNRYEGPGKEEAIAKLRALYKSEGLELPSAAASEAMVAVLLTSAGAAVETPSDIVLQRPGAQLREIAVAVPGAWVKGDDAFSITDHDLRNMVDNFNKRKNDMLVVDYEHASEQPEVAKGGPIPGAGWIHALRFSGLGNRDSGTGNRLPNPEPRTPNPCLTALVEWTPQAEEMLRTGQYRFFSPAIDWNATDKDTGERQGATLTSGALTNHPFLEELPPIMLSDGTMITSGVRGPESGVRSHESGTTDKGAITMTDDKKEKEHALPMLAVRKGRAGSMHEGHHVFSAGGADMGCMSEEDFAAHAKKHLGANPDADGDEQLMDPEEKLSDAEKKTFAEARRQSLILSEVAKDGRLDTQAAIRLSDSGRITFADYIRAQDAERRLEAAIHAGKILPRDRKFFFRDALERPAEFFDYIQAAPQVVRLGSSGIGEGQRPNVNDEISVGVKKLMSENAKLDYAGALRQFLSENPTLVERRRKAAAAPLPLDSDAAPHNGGVVF